MNRREAVKHIGLGLAAFTLPTNIARAEVGSSAIYRKKIPELFAPVARAPNYVRALVIGSGFGGAITALRLGQAGIEASVPERGFRWPNDPWREIFTDDITPDGRGYWFRDTSFPSSGLPAQSVDRFGGVLDIVEYDNMTVGCGACVGGGSIVYAGVMIQPKRHHFDAIFEGQIDYTEMDSVYYPLVKQMLGASQVPEDIYNSAPFGHHRAWERQMRLAGLQPERALSTFNWNVVRAELRGQSKPSSILGYTYHGNSNGAKHDLNQNYLKQAEATGKVRIYPGHEVKDIHRDGSRYVVDVITRLPDGQVLSEFSLTCDSLFLSAGTMGTSRLLLRAKARGGLPDLNEHIGEGWGGNGDTAALRFFSPYEGLTQAVPMTSVVYDESTGIPTQLSSGTPFGATTFNIGLLVTGGVALDLQNRGRLVYDSTTDCMNLLWPKHANDSVVSAMFQLNQRVAHASGSVASPFIYGNTSLHPLGGAVMGKAIDYTGRVYGYENLYVMDGASIPGNTGPANPSWTIAALAERNIVRILAEDF